MVLGNAAGLNKHAKATNNHHHQPLHRSSKSDGFGGPGSASRATTPSTATTTTGEGIGAAVRATAFERLTYALQNEPRFAEEVALGRRVGAYKFIKDIGRGNFSKVKLAAHQLTRDNVAVKIVDRSRLDARAQRMLSSEVLTLESLHHPNILRLFEVIEMWNRVYLITEFIAGGELYNKISLDGPIREPQAIVLFKQLIEAVKYMVSLVDFDELLEAEDKMGGK